MKTATPALTALLNTRGSFVVADLYTLTLIDGTVIRWSGSDQLVSYGGNTWVLGPAIDRTQTAMKIGVEVDTLTMTLMPRANDFIESVPLAAFIANGGLDGARLKLERAYAPDGGSPFVGTIVKFSGRVGAPQGSPYAIDVNAQSDMVLLNTMMPRNVYEPGCNRTLYSSDCGVNRAAFTIAGAVTSSGGMAFGTNLSAAADYYDLGVIVWLTGANAGLYRTVRAQDGSGNVTLVYPLPVAAAVGDTFKIYPACDKTRGPAGCARFANLNRYRGFPYVPVVETSL